MTVQALNRIEIYEWWEIYHYAAFGYRLKHYGDRFFMVRVVH